MTTKRRENMLGSLERQQVTTTQRRRRKLVERLESFVAKYRTSNAPEPTSRIREYASGFRYRVWSDGSFRRL